MSIDPMTALQAASRRTPASTAASANNLLVIGAAGALGSAMLEQALGSGRYATVHVATTGPLQTAMRGLAPLHFTGAPARRCRKSMRPSSCSTGPAA